MDVNVTRAKIVNEKKSRNKKAKTDPNRNAKSDTSRDTARNGKGKALNGQNGHVEAFPECREHRHRPVPVQPECSLDASSVRHCCDLSPGLLPEQGRTMWKTIEQVCSWGWWVLCGR